MTTGDRNSPMATGADTEGMLLIHRVIRRELSLAPANLRDYGSGPRGPAQSGQPPTAYQKRSPCSARGSNQLVCVSQPTAGTGHPAATARLGQVVGTDAGKWHPYRGYWRAVLVEGVAGQDSVG